jgi:hypothetical protein
MSHFSHARLLRLRQVEDIILLSMNSIVSSSFQVTTLKNYEAFLVTRRGRAMPKSLFPKNRNLSLIHFSNETYLKHAKCVRSIT